MRDYTTISDEEFVAESIEMKLRWLARQLRKIDKAEEIERWVLSVTSVHDLLRKIITERVSCLKKTSARLKPQLQWQRWSISAPHMIMIEDDEYAVMKEQVVEEVQLTKPPRVDLENEPRLEDSQQSWESQSETLSEQNEPSEHKLRIWEQWCRC